VTDIELASVAAIKEILYPEGFHFSKSMGQNFLVAPSVPERIAQTLPDDGKWGVLEVGPGLGALTDRLSMRAGKLLAIELDNRLMNHLRSYFADRPVTVVEGDVLKCNLRALAEEHLAGYRLAAYANLPYYITTPAISALLEAGIFESVTLMVQKEVARRICSAPGSEDYSAFTVYCQYHAVTKTLFQVPAGCFYPAPKVDSAVIRLERLSSPPAEVEDKELFFKVVRASFENRRKTLSNSVAPVAGGKEACLSALERAGIDPRTRGEALSIPQFATLAREIGRGLTSF